MLTTIIGNEATYDYNAEKFKKAFQFLRETDFSKVPEGRIVIDGDNLFAEVQEYTTKHESECMFEAHRKYFDIQYMAEGEEYFGFIPKSELVEDTGYDATRDLEFFKAPKINGRIHLTEGAFAIVSPEDGHQPRCIGETPCKVKKVVVKVKVD